MSSANGALATALADLEEERTSELVQRALDAGEDSLAILEQCREGMALVGKRYEENEYFLSDLILAAEIFKNCMATLQPRLATGSVKSRGTVVFGTVKGDVHDIGKNIVVALLRGNGMEVHDLGVDVPPEAIVAKVKETGASIVGLSALLTVSFEGMKDTVDALARAGLRDSVKVMVGGGPVDESVRRYVGADAVGRDATAAIELANRFALEVVR